MESFNRYLKYSFNMPLHSRLAQAGLSLNAATANAEVRNWLTEVTNCRIMAKLGKGPDEQLAIEQAELQPLPKQKNTAFQHEKALSFVGSSVKLLVEEKPKGWQVTKKIRGNQRNGYPLCE